MTNRDSDSVSVIDTITNTVTRTIQIYLVQQCIEAPAPGPKPYAVVVTPDGMRAYVTTIFGCFIVVLDTATSGISTYIFPPKSPFLGSMAIAPEGNRAYLTATEQPGGVIGDLLVIDTTANIVTDVVGVGTKPGDIALSPDGRFAYVSHTGTSPRPGNTVSVIETATNSIGATVEVGDGPEGIAITPNGAAAYVASRAGMSVIDTVANTVIATIPLSTGGSHVAVTPDGKSVYVSACGMGTCVIDTATNTRKPDILGHGEGIALTSDGAHAYLTQPSSDTVAVISTAANAITARIRMPYCGRLYDSPLNPKAPCSPTGIAIASLPHGCPACAGDCNTDGTVTINEVMTLVNIALGNGSVGTCPAADANRDGQVTIHEILQAVNVLLFSHDLGSCWAGLASR